MIDRDKGYGSENTMREILHDNSLLVKTIGRFGIAFGFGEDNVSKVCSDNNVDTATFLTVCNLLSGYSYEADSISLESLMQYLKRAHASFLEVSLPEIRMQLIEAINHSQDNEVAMLLLKYYDEYVAEVKAHMDHENNKIFEYIDALLHGNVDGDQSIAHYSDSHDDIIIRKLNDLKDIFIYHYKQGDNQNLSSTLFNIVLCEKDLLSHFKIENRLLIPVAERLERRLSDKDPESKIEKHPRQSSDSISQRECDIIRCVAKGLSNKEIADTLFISAHTVATHRRNIYAKLGIHSTAALALYAVINGIIPVSELKHT